MERQPDVQIQELLGSFQPYQLRLYVSQEAR